MLISISKKIIFVANTKAASTTIESRFKQAAEVAVTKTAFGKHMPYKNIVKNYGFLLCNKGLSVNDYFSFGVMRDPIDWCVSWYNYRYRDELVAKQSPKSTYNVTFEVFAEELMSAGSRKPYANIGKQRLCFVDKNDVIAVDYLIPMSRLNEEIDELSQLLKIGGKNKVKKKDRNISPKIISVDDVSDNLKDKLQEHFRDDYELYHRANKDGFGVLEDVVKSKLNL